jgi:hypothetical protein
MASEKNPASAPSDHPSNDRFFPAASREADRRRVCSLSTCCGKHASLPHSGRAPIRSAAAVLSLILLLSPSACRRESAEPETIQDLIAREYKFPEGWNELNGEALRLFTEGQKAESTALLESFVESHPDFADAHFALAANHEFIALDMKDDPAQVSERKQHLEAAVAHYDRFRTLSSEPEDRGQASNLLIDLYGPDGLNRMDEAVAVARQYIIERPTNPAGHAKLARMLRWQGSHELGTAVLLEALQRFPPGERDSQLNDELVAHVQETPQMSREDAERLLGEALSDAERQIGVPSTRGLGLLLKSRALRAAARRIEQNPDRQRELEAEYERLQTEGLALLVQK